MIWQDITLLILFSILLVISGIYLVKSLTKIARFLKLSEFVAGFIIMAIATSLPELFVGITSALKNNTALALGTVIGSNIADLTLVAGIAVLSVKGFNIESKKTQVDSIYMVAMASLPIILTIIGKELSRIDGIILLIAFSIYARRLFKQRKTFRKEFKEPLKRKDILFSGIIFVLSLYVLFFSAQNIVNYATLLATELNIAPIIIGLFAIAIGTSLPELSFSLVSVAKGQTEIFLGDIIGSVIINSTLVLGVTAIILPISADLVLFLTSGAYMIIVTFIFATFIESGNRLYWKEGLSLVLLYVFFFIIEFYIKVIGG